MQRVVKRATLLLLTADDYDAELAENPKLAKLLRRPDRS
jgi:hypothetical protein